MAGDRPDPDQLLARVQADEARAGRGRLRIFFGASAGVGKTYAMLEAARAAQAAGTDVAVGYVEPHGRRETESLLQTLECLPTLAVHYRGVTRQEFDLDAALRRRPEILLVDELAHSNLIESDPPPRHAKRWQDIRELCDAGINVWTTLNIQHIESLNDLIAQITGVRQRETIPDQVLDEADEIELIDLPPEDLLQRLRQGKVYVSDQVATAIERFFRKPNLIALRELALRRTADRVDAAARAQGLPGSPQSQAYLARDRLLVAVGPDAQAEQLVRTGKRLADAMDAEWTAVYVETPALQRLSTAERDRRIDILRLAESLGAGTVTLDGPTAAIALMEYARTRGITRVLVGEPKRRGWRALVRPSTATELIKRARGFDVLVVAHQDGERSVRAQPNLDLPREVPWSRYGWAMAVTLACTGIAFLLDPIISETNVAMVYVLGATIAGLRLGRGPGILTAVACVAAFDFCFVPPRFTLQVSDAQYVITFVVMLAVTLTIGNLMANVRQQNRVAGARERRTALLYAMSRELAGTRGIDNMARVAVTHVAEVFDSVAIVLTPDATGHLAYPVGAPSRVPCVAPISLWRSGSSITASGPGSGPTRCRPPRPSTCLCGAPSERSVCSACCRPTGGASCCPSSGGCWRRSLGRSRSPGNVPPWAKRRRSRGSPPRPKACAIRCWRRSRTICVRRWRSSPAPPARSPATVQRWMQRPATPWPSRSKSRRTRCRISSPTSWT